jgi:MFS family permease
MVELHSRRGSMAVALVVTTSGLLPVYLTGALSVQMRGALRFGDTGLGAAVAGFFAGAVLSSVGSGYLAARRGASRMMRDSLIATGLALLFSGAFTSSWIELVVLLALAGAAFGAGQPATNLFLADSGPRHRQGLAFGVKQAAAPAATLVAGLSVPVVGVTIGWRWAFIGAGLCALTGALLVRGGRASVDRAVSRGQGLRLRALVVLTSATTLGSAAGSALGAFVVAGAVQIGFSAGLAGVVAGAGSALGIVARIGVGDQADRRWRRLLWAVAMMLAGGTIGFSLLAFGQRWWFVVGIAIAFASGWGWAGLFNLAIVRAYPHAPAQATGISQMGAYLGGMLGPLAFGLVITHASYRVAWICAAATAACAAVMMLVGHGLLSAERPGPQLPTAELDAPSPHLMRRSQTRYSAPVGHPIDRDTVIGHKLTGMS